jgi:uncharacterized damage-inducible protein DinB
MKKMNWIFASLLLLASSGSVFAQPDKPAAYRPASHVADEWITRSETQLVAAADAMPADKYSFAPTSGEFRGVRNFARQVKHVAAVNYLCAAGILGEQAPADAADERGPDSARTKAEIIKYLKDSFVYLHKAAATIDEKNAFEPIKSPFGQGNQTRIGLAAAALAHSSNHYGQMVEYLRMNGIVPPASQ